MKLNPAVLCILFLAATAAHAQEVRGVIFGRVVDPSQAAVSGASVTMTNTATNVSTSLRTNDTGYYEANFLVAGSYQVRVEAQGFKQGVVNGIVLPIGTRLEVGVRSGSRRRDGIGVGIGGFADPGDGQRVRRARDG